MAIVFLSARVTMSAVGQRSGKREKNKRNFHNRNTNSRLVFNLDCVCLLLQACYTQIALEVGTQGFLCVADLSERKIQWR